MGSRSKGPSRWWGVLVPRGRSRLDPEALARRNREEWGRPAKKLLLSRVVSPYRKYRRIRRRRKAA